METYRASHDANMACRDVIDQAISNNYGYNRLSTEIAVTSALEQFSLERVQSVMANTIQHKYYNKRISQKQKEWSSGIAVCPESFNIFIVDKVNPELINLFDTEFQRQMDVNEQE